MPSPILVGFSSASPFWEFLLQFAVFFSFLVLPFSLVDLVTSLVGLLIVLACYLFYASVPIPHAQMFNSSFTYHYPNTTFDPNSQFSYFPPLASSDHPPGVDPLPNSAPNPLTHAALRSQPPFGQDPNAASHAWLANHADPISYVPSIKSLNESLVPTNCLWNSNWTNQPNAAESFPQQTNAFPGMSNGMDNVSLPSEMSSVGGQVMYGSTSVVAGEELETKRRKLMKSDAAVGFPKICEMCNVTTNSPEVYRMHMAGRKHAAQANLMHGRAGLNSAPKIQSKSNGIVKKDPNRVKFPQCVWCEYCKIFCNSQDAYGKHIVGRKHQKNLDQLKELNKGSAPTTIVPSGAINSKAPSKEDLETKKQKVIRGGAAAVEVRTCTICNVVCNSQTAFSSHLSGQKHAAMVAKK